MSNKPPQPPNSVPEEDLSLHENFAPIIAENGLIRQKKAPEVNEESLPAFLTRLDTLQDLVELRHAEQEEQEKQQEHKQTAAQETPVPAQNNSVSTLPAKEDSSAVEKPVLDLADSVSQQTIDSEQTQETPAVTKEVATLVTDIQETIPENLPTEPAPNFSEATSADLPTALRELSTEIVPVSEKTLTKTKKKSKSRSANKKPQAKKSAQQASATGQDGVPPNNPDQTPQQSAKRRRRWPWVLAVLLCLFLGGISGLVPVEKIPVLRELAYAMGFSKDDTSRMSFLRALLTWTDKNIGLPGNWGGDGVEGPSLLARGGVGEGRSATGSDADTAGLNIRVDRAGGKTSLINMQALNELQRKKGYALDGVRGAVKLNPGQEEADLGPAVLRDDAVNVRTESGRAQGDVYFGSDNSAINRNFKDGYDSVKTLARVKNPHIANGVPIDWLTNMTKRTMKTDTALGGVNKELNGTQVAWGSDVADVGEQKPHRDLYHAWITSRMSKYTPNLMLKKGLADSAFLGADIPTTASNVLSFTGIQVDMDSLQTDQKEWNEYLEWEKVCKEELSDKGASGKIDNAINEYNNLFVQFNDKATPNVGFPQDCSPDGLSAQKQSEFVGKISTIVKLCNTVTNGYNVLREKCDMHSFEGSCDTTIVQTYSTKWSSFQGYCEDKYKEAEEAWKKAWCQAHKQQCEDGDGPPDYPWPEWVNTDSKKYTQTAWNNGRSIEDDVKQDTGADSEYFAAVIRAQVDADGNVTYIKPEYEEQSQKNVQKTIYEGMQENKTL